MFATSSSARPSRPARPLGSALAALAGSAILALVVVLPVGAVANRPLPSAAPVPAAFGATTVDLGLAPIVGGLTRPVVIAGARDGRGRLFVGEQGGRIRIVKDGTVLPTPFLDIRSKVSTSGERGLLGLAFHPGYRTNRKLYVFYTGRDGDLTISQFNASVADPDRAYPTEKVILRIEHSRYANHNGGQLAFGPDGYLYIGTGDGGGGGDPLENGQNRRTLLGKLLRIDVNRASGGRNYTIPSTNPYARSTVFRREIWSYGLRNPWRFSFDRSTGDLYIGDVGQARTEEVDRAWRRLGGGRGTNWGWDVMEGGQCYEPSTGCSRSGKALPLAVYAHAVAGADNCSITGGYVYRGSNFPDMVGGYFFGDFCSGRIWSLSATAGTPQAEVLQLDSGAAITTFGEDDAGELFLADVASGVIYRLVDQG
ncbi:MAG: PQQ-dependent sugar dehydrogenase [Chloroflexi bacterium]|nr:PQQ-dependent sugar dehydrogenase [Chloroflexota bacterium]